jgi:hypothetical protein
MSEITKSKKVDLQKLFINLQRQMIGRLTTDDEAIPHPTTKGDASEANWKAMLSEYLPKRYQVENGFLIDYTGSISDQLDVIIIDRQYSPFLFKQDGCNYVPAESVYAVFEVKPELDADNVAYAGEKMASARRLTRTSVPIVHAGGTYKPRQPQPIIGGILTFESAWRPAFGDPLSKALSKLDDMSRLEFGCILKDGSFRATYDKGGLTSIEYSKVDTGLMFFFLRLLAHLQSLATVTAIDFDEYGKNL